MLKRLFLATVFFAVSHMALGKSLSVPFAKEGFQVLSFGNIAANTYDFSGSDLVIRVDNSAGPLIFPLSQSQSFSRLRVSAKQLGALSLKEGTQGATNHDDFTLKVGLVFAGQNRLNFLQKLLAADWIKQLYRLAPAGTGISKIHFYTVNQDSALTGTIRQHPLSELLYEEYIGPADEQGNILFDLPIQDATEVLALWISADGDDTDSSFEIQIHSIELFN
jgi:hypothetical protein